MLDIKRESIEMPSPEGTWPVEGDVVGQLIVHESFNTAPPNWTVSHIKSGCYLSRFWKQEDAITFALQSQDVFNFDDYVWALAHDTIDFEWRERLDDMKLLRESLPSYYKELADHSGREATMEYLREVVNAQ